MWYIDQEGTLPVPLNIIPPPKLFIRYIKLLFKILFPSWFQKRKQSEEEGKTVGGILGLAGMKMAVAGMDDGNINVHSLNQSRSMKKFEKKFAFVCYINGDFRF